MPEDRTRPFNEAFDFLAEAIRIEGRNRRIAIHPYSALFRGTHVFIENGGTISPKQREELDKYLADATQMFHYDKQLLEAISTLTRETQL